MNDLFLRLALISIAWGGLAWPTTASGKNWYVHLERGGDDRAGTQSEPFATAQRAVNSAQPGDVIHLLPDGAVYRQSITFNKKTDITLDGHGVTLDGSDPLPADGWEVVGEGLRRRRLRQTPMKRHLLTFDGRTEHMDRTQSGNSRPFPQPEELTDGQFAFVPIDESEGWLYVRGTAELLEWSTRVNGLATGGENRGLVVKNLNARRFLNDGFNIHGNSRDLRFSHIDGYECFDEGFSAHDTCTCQIEYGRFWGCENAIADVNDCETDYTHSEFSRSLSTDVLLAGRRHSFVDCRIINTPPSTALSASARGRREQALALLLERVAISCATEGKKPRVRFDNVRATLRSTDLNQVEASLTGSTMTLGESTATPQLP